MQQVVVRKMKNNDLDVVSELAMLGNPFAEKEKYRKHLEEELDSNLELAFVAVKGGRVIGYVMGDLHNSHSVLEDIAVNVKSQHQGIGTLLIEAELEALKSSEAKIVVVEVHYKCASSIPFYYKHGFRMSGVWRNFFGMNHDAIMLVLIL